MKYFLSILIMVGLFIGCNKLDKPTEYMADKILASDSFDFCTYQPSCLGANEIVLRKTSTSKPLLTVFVEEK